MLWLLVVFALQTGNGILHGINLLPLRLHGTVVSMIMTAGLTTPKGKFCTFLLVIFFLVLSVNASGRLAYSQDYIYIFN